LIRCPPANSSTPCATANAASGFLVLPFLERQELTIPRPPRPRNPVEPGRRILRQASSSTFPVPHSRATPAAQEIASLEGDCKPGSVFRPEGALVNSPGCQPRERELPPR